MSSPIQIETTEERRYREVSMTEMVEDESTGSKSPGSKASSNSKSAPLEVVHSPAKETSSYHTMEDLLHVFDMHAPVARYQWDKDHTTKIFRGGHLEENWLSGFLDLILVAALIKLGDGLHYCGLTFEEYFFVAIEFVLLFKTRYMMDEFMWHFFLDDVWNQMLYFIFICGVFLMTLMVSYSHVEADGDGSSSYDAPHEECDLEPFHINLFYVGLIVTRIALSLYWVVELLYDTEARDQYYMQPVRNLIAIILAIFGLLLNSSGAFQRFHNYYVLLAIALVEYYLSFYKAIHKKPAMELNKIWPISLLKMKPHDHDHEKLFECDEELTTVQDRCGQFMLVVLGESMIQLLIPSFDSEYRDKMLILTMFGLLMVWSIAKQFFDAAQRVPHDHALRRCMQSGYLWILLHSVAGWFTFLVGVGLKLLYTDLRYGNDVSYDHLTAISVGSGGAVMTFTAMRFLHKGWGEYPSNKPRILGYLLRFTIAGLHFSVIAWGITDPGTLVIAHCAIAVLLNSLDLYNFKKYHYTDEDPLEMQAGNESDERAGVVSPDGRDGSAMGGSISVLVDDGLGFGGGNAGPRARPPTPPSAFQGTRCLPY